MDIMGALSVIKQTIDITKDLRNIDEKIDAATWKLRLNEIIEKLVDTKDALLEAKEIQATLKEEIEALTRKLSDRGRFSDENGQLFEIDEAGARIGSPYCNHCYVKEDKRFRLRHFEARPGVHSQFKCDHCKVTIITGPGLPVQSVPDRDPWIRR